jgi:hypothetical protein
MSKADNGRPISELQRFSKLRFVNDVVPVRDRLRHSYLVSTQ